MIATTVPITVSNDAIERVNQLGFQKELEELLDHTVQAVPDLVRIEVTYTYNFYFAPEDPVEIAAFIKSDDIDEHLRIMDGWNRWKHTNFPGEASLYFTFITATERDDAIGTSTVLADF